MPERASSPTRFTSSIFSIYFLSEVVFASGFELCPFSVLWERAAVVIDMSMLCSAERSDHAALRNSTRSKFLAARSSVAEQFHLERYVDVWRYLTRNGRRWVSARSDSRKVQRHLFDRNLFSTILIINIEFNFFHMNRYIANLIAIGLVSSLEP